MLKKDPGNLKFQYGDLSHGSQDVHLQRSRLSNRPQENLDAVVLLSTGIRGSMNKATHAN